MSAYNLTILFKFLFRKNYTMSILKKIDMNNEILINNNYSLCIMHYE